MWPFYMRAVVYTRMLHTFVNYFGYSLYVQRELIHSNAQEDLNRILSINYLCSSYIRISPFSMKNLNGGLENVEIELINVI